MRGRGRIAAVLVVVLAVAAGCGSGEETTQTQKRQQDAPAAKATEHGALAEYERYLKQEGALLVKWTRKLKDEIARADQFGATFKYTNSRVHYWHLQPAARLSGGPDAGPNAGFHEIERTLYKGETTEGLKSAAGRLVADARQLGGVLAQMEMPPLALSKAAEQLLREASGKMMAGREDPHAGIGLVDVSASVEGAEKAFEALEPLLANRDPQLVKKLEAAFAEAYERLAEHGAPGKLNPGPEAGTYFVPYGDLDQVEIREISQPLDTLRRLMGEATERLEAP
jgi:iron uptake system component EfeO